MNSTREALRNFRQPHLSLVHRDFADLATPVIADHCSMLSHTNCFYRLFMFVQDRIASGNHGNPAAGNEQLYVPIENAFCIILPHFAGLD